MELEFKQTCAICPEQYDVFYNEKMVAYIRLRWGRLTVECPDIRGKLVFHHQFKDGWKGGFDSEEERKDYLEIIKKVIESHINGTAKQKLGEE